jgi:hypothetical protein
MNSLQNTRNTAEFHEHFWIVKLFIFSALAVSLGISNLQDHVCRLNVRPDRSEIPEQ